MNLQNPLRGELDFKYQPNESLALRWKSPVDPERFDGFTLQMNEKEQVL